MLPAETDRETLLSNTNLPKPNTSHGSTGSAISKEDTKKNCLDKENFFFDNSHCCGQNSDPESVDCINVIGDILALVDMNNPILRAFGRNQ